ncbi:MAG: metal ABC transporter permease [bacterium]|nr:metal ABC transporter permease [bacterium]
MGQLILNIKDILNTFPEAVLTGLIIGIVCSFLGVFVVLKRVVFIGATLSQVAACGIALALFFNVNPFFGAAIFTMFIVTILSFPIEKDRVPQDAVMGCIFVFTSALSILVISRSGLELKEVESLIYGNLILTSPKDLKIIIFTILPVISLVILFLRPIIYTFVDREEAKVLGVNVTFWGLFFFYCLSIVVSASSKVGGMVLVFCYLVIPPTMALFLTNRLIWSCIISVTVAIFSTLLGFYFSFTYDFPTNQTIVVTSFILLLLSYTGKIFMGWIYRNFRKKLL